MSKTRPPILAVSALVAVLFCGCVYQKPMRVMYSGSQPIGLIVYQTQGQVQKAYDGQTTEAQRLDDHGKPLAGRGVRCFAQKKGKVRWIVMSMEAIDCLAHELAHVFGYSSQEADKIHLDSRAKTDGTMRVGK